MLLRSVKNWLTILVVALVALAMAVAWVYVVPPLSERLDQQKLVDSRASVNTISRTLQGLLRYNTATGETVVVDDGLLEEWIRVISMQLNARTVILSRDLKTLTGTAGLHNFRTDDFPMLAQAVRTKQPTQGIVSSGGERYAATAVPLFPEGGPRVVSGVILVAAPLTDVDNAVAAVQRRLLLATILAIAISAVLGYAASYFIARRLKRIERSAEAIAGGDLTAKVEVSVEDEIGQLAGTFNIMADKLRAAFAAVEYERDRIEVLLNDLSEGVVGLSADGQVTIANPAAAALLERELRPGQAVAEAFPPDVVEAWRDARDEEGVQSVIFLQGEGERTLEAAAYPVGGEADFTSIVVLRDVTAQARLERARRDLIANASHEFKTPLFSLAGSLELLDEGDLSPDEQAEFLQIMRQQVDRLRDLAVSMLDLSRVEAGSIEIHPEHVDLHSVARSVLDEFQAQAQARELTLLAADDGGHTAWCDEQRLAQVLRALVDNAVKFSPPGSTVSVATGAADDTGMVTVSDNGPGIAPAELPHVFERFHRGRGERGSTTGAGLGLSIARELSELMGGSISAETRPEGGARFTIRLPGSPPRQRPAADATPPSS
jgi:two-component system sensor histidine kinase VicK